ncbi:MAG: hypothetical protein WCJ53_01735 [Mycobacteriaceae bacterium]
MADCNPSVGDANYRPQRTPLPVVRWLQAGAVVAGMAIAVVATPAIASADNGGTSSESDVAKPAAAHRSPAVGRHTAADTATVSSRNAGARPAASVARKSIDPAHSASAVRRVVRVPMSTSMSPTAKTTASAVSTDPLGNLSAFLGLPGAPATSAPSLSAFPLLLRLTLEDVFSGTGPTTVTNPTAVVTGLFNQVLRETPSTDELQNYLGIFGLTGVNGVVSGLYSSSQFRQQEVANYYLELLSRPATQQEISWGASELMWGTPEPLFAASIASTREFYAASSSGGGQFGPKPSATTYVNLLYRSMLGQPADANAASIYVQKLQAGQGTWLTAVQFVTADPFRTVKVGEIYQVLGQTASTADIAGYLDDWFRDGGLAGIATTLLAGATNVSRIEAGQVTLPANLASAGKLQTLLLSPYTETADGFYAQFGTLLSLDPANPISKTNKCTTANTSCDQSLFQLLTAGGTDRGLPNNGMYLTSIYANVATLIPTQKEIDISKSLKYPLQNPDQLTTLFTGGAIQTSPAIVTADNGTYIIDGHHRWSSIVLINPYTQVTALDLGYVPTPQDGLKQAQIGVAVVNDYLPQSTVTPGTNLYDMSEDVFNATVNDFILNAADAHPEDPNPTVSWTDQVLQVFADALNFKTSKTPIDEQYTIVDNYLWANVLRMRELNPFVPGATSRSIMPQTDPLPLTQTYFAGGALSYSFPTVSYLG